MKKYPEVLYYTAKTRPEDLAKPYPPPMTNADRIRSMTDEELAEWIVGRISCEVPDSCPAYPSCVPSMEDMGCKDWICNWLKQEVEEC